MIEKKALETRIKELDIIIAGKQASISKAPSGSVRINPKGDCTYYVYICRNEKRHLKVTYKKDQMLARALAQKAYDECVFC